MYAEYFGYDIIYLIQFADLFKDIKKQTREIKGLEKKRLSNHETENQPSKKRRRTTSESVENFHGGGIHLQFRRTYNTRSRKKASGNDESNDSENENEENDLSESKRNRSKLRVLFPWAKPFQRSIDLMKMGVCDVDEEEEEEDYKNDSFDENRRERRVYKVTRSAYDPESIPSVDEITQEMLDNVAKKSSLKTYCKINGTSCHQCRQKTLDTKTVCRSGECVGIRGQFCGPCLQGRYGENAIEALKDPVS